MLAGSNFFWLNWERDRQWWFYLSSSLSRLNLIYHSYPIQNHIAQVISTILPLCYGEIGKAEIVLSCRHLFFGSAEIYGGYKLSLYSIYCHFVQWRNQWQRNCVMPELSRRLFWGVVKFMRVLVAPHVMMQIGYVWLLYKSYPSWIHVFAISSFKFFPNNHSL